MNTQPSLVGRGKENFSRLAPHPPAPPRESNSRAGRNVPAATATAFALIGIVGLTLFFQIQLFIGLVAVFLTLALWEYAGAVLNKQIRIPFIPLAIVQLTMIFLTWNFGLTAGFLTFVLGSFLTVVYVQLVDKALLKTLPIGIFGIAWIGLSGMFAVAMAGLPVGPQLLTAAILLPIANDTGGWCAGVLFGKHPILPRISPKKSWEGLLGSFLLCLLAAYLGMGLMLGLSWPWIIGFAVVTPILATAGDFAESMIKRELGIKDMGSIFPGHGGALDRIDSLLFCAPAFYMIYLVSQGLL
ncbi:MAG: phosphatidate cytidylyltransferase [Arcanobacterium sp.]|nr:phosphatidate cytidylyltransferase [Arcanobacterium sp.]